MHGVIDFADMVEAPYVYEIAIAIAHTMIKTKNVDPMEVGGLMLAGYTKKMELSEEELEAVRICVAARCCQLYVLESYYEYSNKLELSPWLKNLWCVFKAFWGTPSEEIDSRWKNTMESYKLVT